MAMKGVLTKKGVHISLEEFMLKVFPEPNTGCWLWSGCPDKDGYGNTISRPLKLKKAHRISFYLHFGDFDRSKLVLHKCDNPSCVNPQHLYLGNFHQNMADRNTRKRTSKGEKKWSARLTENDVIEIREKYKTGGYWIYDLAKEYGISSPHTSLIILGKKWSHVK